MFGITVLSEEGQNWAAQCLPGAEQVGGGELWTSSVSAAVKQRSFTSFVEILIKHQPRGLNGTQLSTSAVG